MLWVSVKALVMEAGAGRGWTGGGGCQGPGPAGGTPMHSGCLQRVCSEGPGAWPAFTIILLPEYSLCAALCQRHSQTFSLPPGPGVGVRVELVQLRMQV